MGKGEIILLVLFAAIFLFSVFMLLQSLKITGFASSGTTVSNVTVSKAFSITLSDNLSFGISFGNVSTLEDINATRNYNVVNGTDYIVNLSSTATINIDLCIKGDADMRDSTSGDLIGINNESFANTSVTNLSVPSNA